MSFRVACAQTAPAKAQIEQNLDEIAQIALQAQDEGAELVQFPETAVSGYFVEGGALENAMEPCELAAALEKRLAGKLKRPLDAVIGFYERSGGDLFNSAAYLEFSPSARVVSVYRKFFLPTYGVFDEERFVSRGHSLGLVQSRLGKFAILICEDVWHSVLPMLCALQGAQAVLCPSASPGRGFSGETTDNHDRYRRMLRAISEEHGVWCVNTQLCGFEGGKGFIGGSCVIDPMGHFVAEGPVQEPHLLLADVDLDLISIARAQSPLLSDLESAWADLRRIIDER